MIAARAILVALAAFAAASCGVTRENARAVIQAQQATEAGARILTAPELGTIIAKLSPEDRVVVERAVRAAIALMRCANGGLRAPAALLQAGEQVAVATTVDQAVDQTDAFVAEATRQAGRADAEATADLAVLGAWRAFAAMTGDDWMDLLVTALKGTALGVPAAAALGLWRKGKAAAASMQEALGATAQLADTIEAKKPDADVAMAKAHAKVAQLKAGVHAVVQRARGKAVT